MKPLSMDLRERIVQASEQDGLSTRKIAQRFAVSKNSVEQLIKQKRTQGHLMPGKQGGAMVDPVMAYKAQLLAIVEQKVVLNKHAIRCSPEHQGSIEMFCSLLAALSNLWKCLRRRSP